LSHDLRRQALEQRVRELAQTLRDNQAVDDSKSPPIAGWHNAFRAGRIGTTGTALPLLFLSSVGETIPELHKTLEALRQSQFDTGAHAGGWSILSLGVTPNVEGTTWPLLALRATGDDSDLARIGAAAKWLSGQQNADGGWGSTKGNASRVVLTAATMRALGDCSPLSAKALVAAEAWLRRVQRRQDHSWGPIEGQPGTVHHTCIALEALLARGARINDPSIVGARDYVIANWKPDARRIQTETYDAEAGAAYQRVVLEHDVDALACQALMRLRGPGDLDRCARAAKRFLQTSPEEIDAAAPTLWNALPRGFVANELLKLLPATNDGRLVTNRGAAAAVTGSGAARAWHLLLLAVREALPKRLDHVALAVGVAVFIALVVLLVVGTVSTSDFLLGAVLPMVLAVYGVLSARRDD
jgi:hypothetical protein